MTLEVMKNSLLADIGYSYIKTANGNTLIYSDSNENGIAIDVNGYFDFTGKVNVKVLKALNEKIPQIREIFEKMRANRFTELFNLLNKAAQDIKQPMSKATSITHYFNQSGIRTIDEFKSYDFSDMIDILDDSSKRVIMRAKELAESN